MRTSNILLLFFSLTSIVAACCGAKSSTSCCGKGRCNIFCCNCDGGCKSVEECCRLECGHGCIKGGELPNICATICHKQCTEEARELSENSPFSDVEPAWLAMSDDQIFDSVRSDDKDHFTYGEYLTQRGWDNTSDAREFFDRFDRNKDGIITIDEMREHVEEGTLSEAKGVAPKPVPTPIVVDGKRDEL